MSEPTKPRSNLTLRLLTAAVAVPLLLYSLFLPPTWLFPLLTLIVCGLGAYELFAMTAPQHPITRIWGVGACLWVCWVVEGLFGPAFGAPTFVIVTLFGLLTSLVQPEPMAGAAARTAWAIAGPAYIGGLFGVIANLFHHKH